MKWNSRKKGSHLQEEQINVLHIDDEEEFLEITKNYLKKINPNLIIRSVSSLGQALELISQYKFEVIISDYQMLENSGGVLLEKLKRKGLTIPFIIATGGREEVIIDVINLGVDRYLKKGKDLNISFTEIDYYILRAVQQKKTQKLLIDSEQALQNSNERLLKAQRVARMGFLDWNLKTDRILLSDEIINLYGLDPTRKWTTPELVAHVVHPDDMEYVQENLEMAMKGIKKYNIDHRVVRPDGTVLWVHAQAKLTRDEEGNPQELLGTVVDITLRKEAEEALKKSEEVYQDLYENAPDMYASIELRTKTIIRCNHTLATNLGYMKEEIIGKAFFEIYHPDYREEAQKVFHSFVKTGEVHGAELQLKRKDGSKIDVSLNVTAVHDEQGNILYSRSALRDITQIKRAEKELQETKEKYQMLVEKLEEGVLLEDVKGKISFVNPKTLKLLGYTESELLGKDWTTIVSAETLDIAKTESRKRPKGIGTSYEIALQTKEKNLIPVIVSATPIYSKSNEFSGVLSVFTDITEQKKYQQLQDRFVAITAHELRTPLTVIKGYTDFLNKNPKLSTSRRDKIYSKLTSNTARLGRLVSNVHDLTKITHELFNVSPCPIDLNNFVEIIHDQCTLIYPRNTITVDYINYSKKNSILMDQDQILHAIHNLISNAIKNSPERRPVEIAIIRYPTELTITVQDYGVGIPLENFISLFQPFSHTKVPPPTSGLGLGLYIVKSIVLAHKGRVEVLSQEQLGSSFTMCIPAE